MGLILGLDGGGSKTLLAVADETGEVVRLELSLGLDPAQGQIWKDRLADLLQRVAPLLDAVDGAVFGLSSHGEIAAQDEAQRQTVACLAGPGALVDNDVRIAFDGAFAGKGGILLLAGTGSMAWAGEGGVSGRQVRVGGWGEPFGDEGSAFWIGREALGLATRALDGRHPAARGFADALLARIGIRPTALCAWAFGFADRRAGIASLSREVAALAEGGDKEASRLIETAAGHLADHAGAARITFGSADVLDWSYAGSVFSGALFRNAVAARLGSAPVPPRLPPVGGALLRAAERAGWPNDDAFVERLARSLALRLDLLSRPPQP